MLSTIILCALLVVASLCASGTSGRVVWTCERDGERLTQRRSLGFISSMRREADASLHVSRDFRDQLERLKLKMSPELDSQLRRAERQPITSLQWHYSLAGYVSGSPKDAVDFYARQIKVTGSRSFPGPLESVNGVCSDGRSALDVTALTEGGRTRVDVGLLVLR